MKEIDKLFEYYDYPKSYKNILKEIKNQFDKPDKIITNSSEKNNKNLKVSKRNNNKK